LTPGTVEANGKFRVNGVAMLTNIRYPDCEALKVGMLASDTSKSCQLPSWMGTWGCAAGRPGSGRFKMMPFAGVAAFNVMVLLPLPPRTTWLDVGKSFN